MQVHSETIKLKALITSYFWQSKKCFLHWGDCNIFSADRPFCSCGLLHRLHHLDYTLANIVYPKFESDMYLQDTGKRYRKSKETASQKAARQILEDVFGPINVKASLEDLKWDYDDMKKVLNTLFTKKMFPSVFKRLERWLQKEVAKEH